MIINEVKLVDYNSIRVNMPHMASSFAPTTNSTLIFILDPVFQSYKLIWINNAPMCIDSVTHYALDNICDFNFIFFIYLMF